MIRKVFLVITLSAFALVSSSQSPGGNQAIAKWKIEDVVNSYSVRNDTVYVVNFWATFCKPCIEEIPHFIKIVEKYKSQKVKLLLVSLDLPSFVPVKLPEFIKKNNFNTNHVWLNETNADHFCPAIDEKWSGAIPSTIIVNNSNGYRKFTEDQMSAEEFETALKAAIGGDALHKYMSPMNDAVVIGNESLQTTLPGDFQKAGVSFKSNDSSVYAITGGKVKTIARIDNIKVVIIEKEDLFYTYSNLSATTIKTGDMVHVNQFIGYAANEMYGGIPLLDLYVSNNERTILLTKKNFIPRKDVKHSDHSIDLLPEPQ